MRPGDRALGAETGSRFHQQTSAEFPITVLRQPRQNEMARMVEKKCPVAVGRKMSVTEAPTSRLPRTPDLIPGGRLQTRETAVAEDRVEVIVVLKQRRRNGGSGFRSGF